WLLASERICVIVFATLLLLPIGREIFTRSRVRVIRIGIGRRRTKCDCGKVRLDAILARSRDELDDLGAHAASSNAMAIRLTTASDIR
ncbi:hypothetical protein chiPu_0032501, partial [Chiloscyllium punctatum]|nr:hypothetical protein [Chiloscyllium punctatum]